MKKNQNFSPTQIFTKEGFQEKTLHDTTYQLNFEELRFNYEEDDPETEDVDEREKVGARLTPRIRIPLQKEFFQEKILDFEGQSVFSNSDSFSKHLRGLIIKADGFNDDLYMLLDISNAQVRIEYEYDEVNTNSTPDDTSDDTTEKASKTYMLNFSFHFNTIKNDNYNSQVDQEILASQGNMPSEKIYLEW